MKTEKEIKQAIKFAEKEILEWQKFLKQAREKLKILQKEKK